MGNTVKRKYLTKDGFELLIRDAKPGDAASIMNINLDVIIEKIYMLREKGEANYDYNEEVKNIERHLKNAGSIFIIVEIEKKIVGYLEFENGSLKRTKHSGMFSMFIMKDWRDKGIGKELLKILIDWAKENPVIEKITLAVFSTNDRAQSLYKSFGFIEEGRCPEDMRLDDGSYIDSVLMYKFVK